MNLFSVRLSSRSLALVKAARAFSKFTSALGMRSLSCLRCEFDPAVRRCRQLIAPEIRS